MCGSGCERTLTPPCVHQRCPSSKLSASCRTETVPVRCLRPTPPALPRPWRPRRFASVGLTTPGPRVRGMYMSSVVPGSLRSAPCAQAPPCAHVGQDVAMLPNCFSSPYESWRLCRGFSPFPFLVSLRLVQFPPGADGTGFNYSKKIKKWKSRSPGDPEG